jgi:hypothetical protein
MFKKQVEDLRTDHPELTSAYDTLVRAMYEVEHKLEALQGAAIEGDKKMGDLVGLATQQLKIGLGKLHDQVRRLRGGDDGAK